MKLTILILALLVLQACQTSHCIKLEGGSQKFGIDSGSIEYCFDGRKSEQEKAAVLVSGDEEYFIVHKKYIEYANEVIQQGVTASGVRQQTDMERFVNLIQEKKNDSDSNSSQ